MSIDTTLGGAGPPDDAARDAHHAHPGPCDWAGAVTSAQQVAWWEVHQWVADQLADVGDWPMAGTPEWCGLDDTDPRKVVALFSAAEHWCLRLEVCQRARAEASHDISAAEDWSAIGCSIRQGRGSAYIPREVA